MSFAQFEALFQEPIDQKLLHRPTRGSQPVVHENKIRATTEVVHISQIEFVEEFGISVLRVERINDPKQLMLEFATSAMDLLPVGVTLTDPNQPDNPLIYVNKTICTMTGYTFEEMVGRNCRFLQRDNRDQPAARDIRTAVANKKPVETTLMNYRKDGSMFYNELHIFPLKDEAGQTVRFLGIQHDVTDRQLAIKDAEHSKRLTAAATTSLGYAFGSLDVSTGKIKPSLRFAKMVGIHGHEIQLSQLLEGFTLAGRDAVEAGINAIMEGEVPVWREQIYFRAGSEEPQPFLVAIAPVVESILGSPSELCLSFLPLETGADPRPTAATSRGC